MRTEPQRNTIGIHKVGESKTYKTYQSKTYLLNVPRSVMKQVVLALSFDGERGREIAEYIIDQSSHLAEDYDLHNTTGVRDCVACESYKLIVQEQGGGGPWVVCEDMYDLAMEDPNAVIRLFVKAGYSEASSWDSQTLREQLTEDNGTSMDVIYWAVRDLNVKDIVDYIYDWDFKRILERIWGD